MKICFVSTFFTTSLLPQIKHLSDKGHDVDAIFLAREGSTNMETFIKFDSPLSGYRLNSISLNNAVYNYMDKSVRLFTVPYRPFNRRSVRGLISYVKNRIVIRNIFKYINNHKYDLIYINVTEEWDVKLCKLLKASNYTNVVIAYHEVLKSHTTNEGIKGVVRDTVNLGFPVVTYSKHTEKTLLQHVPDADIRTVYFGPFETFTMFDISERLIKQKYILFIGSISPYKGLSFMIDTLQKYRISQDIKIVIAGKGYDPGFAKIENDSQFISMNRYLDDNEFANLVNYAECVVCPYMSGSQSGIPQTAMVFHTPVIATDIGAFPEIIDDDKNGFLIKYGDERGFVNVILKALEKDWSDSYTIPEHLEWDNIIDNQFLKLEKAVSPQKHSEKQCSRY